FDSTQPTSKHSYPPPLSISSIHDDFDNYLEGAHINDCGLSTTSPTNAGLIWTYSANTGCPGNGTLTLTINRGDTFQTTTPATVEITRIRISYPYQWRFSSVVKVLIPSAQYAGVTQITIEAVMQNLN